VGAWALFELREAPFYFPAIIEPIIGKIAGSNTVFPQHHDKTRTSFITFTCTSIEQKKFPYWEFLLDDVRHGYYLNL
jgi:hypothetical protein